MPQYAALQREPSHESGKAQVASIFLFRQRRTHRRKFSDSRSFSRQRTLLARLLPRYDESLSCGHRGPSHHRIRQRPVPDSRKNHSLHAQHRSRCNLPRPNARIPTDPKSLARTSHHPSLKFPAPLGFQPHSRFVIPRAANRLFSCGAFGRAGLGRQGSLCVFGCVASLEFCESCWPLSSTGRAIYISAGGAQEYGVRCASHESSAVGAALYADGSDYTPITILGAPSLRFLVHARVGLGFSFSWGHTCCSLSVPVASLWSLGGRS